MSGKGKNPRRRSQKPLHRRRKKSNKLKHSKWKLDRFPEIFKRIDVHPYIVRRDDERYK